MHFLTEFMLVYRDAFDAVYGSSAGAINATYFLSGQRDGVKIYTEEIANKDFIDLSRLINISRKTQGERLQTQQTRDHSQAALPCIGTLAVVQ